MQILFQMDINCREVDEILSDFWDTISADPRDKEFTGELVKGVLSDLTQIDIVIQKYAENWDIGRMGLVDKNIMRVAIFEILHRGDIPPVVSINEAIEVAKEFGAAGSAKFVNGILDSALKEVDRPSREAVEE
jgi:N utilization substance protein B